MLLLLGCTSAEEKEAQRLFDEAVMLDAKGTVEDFQRCDNILRKLLAEYRDTKYAAKADEFMTKTAPTHYAAYEKHRVAEIARQMLQTTLNVPDRR